MQNLHTFRMVWKTMSCWMIVAICLMLVHPGGSMAEELRIDTIQMPPLGFVTEDGQNTGLLYEISNRIAEETGLSYTNQIVPFARMIAELERGDADFSIFFRSAKNDQISIPVATLLSLKNIVIGLKGTQFDSLESLHGKLVARVRGAIYDDAFNQDDAIKKFDTIDYAQGITMLMNKRVDACIGPEIGLLFTAKQLGYARENLGEPLVLNTKDAWMQYSKAAADDEKIAALKAAKAAGALVSLDLPAEEAQRFMPEFQALLQQQPGLEITLAGGPAFYADIETVSQRDLQRAELIAFPLARAR